MFMYTCTGAHGKLNLVSLTLVPHGCNGHEACIANSALQYSENSQIIFSYCSYYAKL